MPEKRYMGYIWNEGKRKRKRGREIYIYISAYAKSKEGSIQKVAADLKQRKIEKYSKTRRE